MDDIDIVFCEFTFIFFIFFIIVYYVGKSRIIFEKNIKKPLIEGRAPSFHDLSTDRIVDLSQYIGECKLISKYKVEKMKRKFRKSI